MQETSNFGLELYELDDMADLTDGYNKSMLKIDSAMKQIEDDAANMFPVDANDISNGAITEDKIATASVTNTKLAAGAVTLDKIADDTIDNIPTQGSNNLVTSDAVYDSVKATNDNLIKQQVNGSYTQIPVNPNNPFTTNSNLRVYKSNNDAYWWASGDAVLPSGTYTLTQIPGTNLYGFRLTNSQIITTPPSNILSFIGTCLKFSQVANGYVYVGQTNLIIGTDGYLYIQAGNAASYNASTQQLFALLQSKLTLTNFNIEPISETPLD